MARIRDGFAATAHRAVCLELDYVQLQTAHAYLLHGFLSPISNPRDDDYGGSLENRIRFPLNVFDAVRQAFRPDRPVTVRITATDWMAGGWSIDDSLAFVDGLKDTWLRRYRRVERRQDLATIDPDWAELPGSAPAGGEAGK